MLFLLGRIGFTSANVFYDALLPHVAAEEDQDRVSTRGYAMGYLGGGILHRDRPLGEPRQFAGGQGLPEQHRIRQALRQMKRALPEILASEPMTT